MSWDPYVQQLVTAGFHHCCIAGHAGHVWGTSPAFKISQKEIAFLATVLNDHPDALHHIQQKGFTICAMPYALNRLDPPEDDIRCMIARCKKTGKPARGAIVAKTAKTIIIGIHDPVYAEGQSFGRARVAVTQLAESLAAMDF